jgi:hypothetical protein
MLRILDPRGNCVAAEQLAHDNIRGAKAVGTSNERICKSLKPLSCAEHALTDLGWLFWPRDHDRLLCYCRSRDVFVGPESANIAHSERTVRLRLHIIMERKRICVFVSVQSGFFLRVTATFFRT